MFKYFSIVLLVLTVFASPAGAQTNKQQEAYELAVLRYYAGVLGSLESIKYLSVTARGSWRSSSLAEGAPELDGSGRLLLGVSNSLKLLARSSDVENQAWLTRWQDYKSASIFVQNVAAAVNLTAQFIDAVQNAETSAAEDTLRAMSEITNDITTLVPASTTVGPYVGVLANTLERIAKDAAIIEAATKRTSDMIALVNKIIVGGDATETGEDLSTVAIDEIQSRIRELAIQEARHRFAEAYGKITVAELACLQDLSVTMDEISGLRRTSAIASREIQNINLAKGANSQLVPSLKLLIETAQTGIIDARVDMQDAEKALAASRRIERLEHELDLYKNELRNTRRSVTERNLTLNNDLIIAQEKLAGTELGLAAFNDCVREQLREPDVELTDLIDTYFPHYINGGSAVVVANTSASGGAGTQPVFEGFDSGVNGWTSSDGPESLSIVDGALCALDINSGWLTLFAPKEFLGSWGKGTGNLSFRVKADSSPAIYSIVVSVSGPEGNATSEILPDQLPSNIWTNHSISLEKADWSVNGDWVAILQNVSSFSIRIDLNDKYTSNELNCIDNIQLTR